MFIPTINSSKGNKLEDVKEITVPLPIKTTEERIAELYAEKTKLLDEYAIFGGGQYVNRMHQRINQELESLGIPE